VNSGEHPPAPRTVRPRKNFTLDKPIIAVDREVLLEDGTVFPCADLPRLVITQPPSIIVVHHPGDLLRDLDAALSSNPRWQFRVTPVRRMVWAPEKQKQAEVEETVVNFFGLQRGHGHTAGHYHYPVSPLSVGGKTANELRRAIAENTSTLHKLMAWGLDLREFLQEHKLRLSPSSGGIAAQLLRDPKFYPEPRRKAPKLINSAIRDKLPGNHYQLHKAREGSFHYHAAYLDQTAAHHNCAKGLSFPCVNDLHARGRFWDDAEDRSFAREGTPKYEQFIKQYGLFYMACEVPEHKQLLVPPELQRPGYVRAYIYSNELPYLRSVGIRFRHIIACWTSPTAETGLNKYAEWALEQIKAAPPGRMAWLKPTLLATYGVLAARPKAMEFGYKHAKNGEPTRYPVGAGFLNVEAKKFEHERESPIVNVLHRGMIEAETRLRSLELARDLGEQGHGILAIYADSVFVEGGETLPFLEPPWRLQSHLTALRFLSSTHFTSHEIEKMPGVPHALRNRARLPKRIGLTKAG